MNNLTMQKVNSTTCCQIYQNRELVIGWVWNQTEKTFVEMYCDFFKHRFEKKKLKRIKCPTLILWKNILKM
jgi:hypothetical protein